MPLPKKKQTKAKTFDELRHGKTFAKTSASKGKKTAQKQMTAIALKQGDKKGFKKPIPGEAKKLHNLHSKKAKKK